MAFFITTAFVVIGVAGWHIRRGRYLEESLTMQKMGLGLMAILVPLQVFIGDQHGLNTLEYQPVKVSAIEANWETRAHMPLLLFAWPDEQAEKNRLEIAIPEAGSLILKHDVNGVVPGLKDWKAADRPPVAIPFFAFRLMVGIGVLMLLITIAGLWLWHRGRLERSLRFQRLCFWTLPLGFAAVVAGWVVTEVGRQPWVVYGLQRTRDAVTPSLSAGDVTVSLLVYVAAYIVIFGAGVYFLVRLVRSGFEEAKDPEPAGTMAATARPLTAGSHGE